MSKSWYQLVKEDQERKKREAAENKARGHINFKEASKASRVQYTRANYEGQSKDKSYKWETDLLKPLSIKGYGRSYNDKFTNWAKSQGMSDAEAAEYRRYMDFQEDRNKKGNLAYGTHLKSEVMDGIFRNMEQRSKRSFANSTRIQQEKQQERQAKEEAEIQKQEELRQKISHSSENSKLNDSLKMGKASLLSALKIKPPGQAAMDTAMDYAREGKRPNDATKELARGITRTANTAGFGVIKEAANKRDDPFYQNEVFNERQGGAKAADFVYDGLGYLAPAAKMYGALNATKLGVGLTKFGATELAKGAAKKEIAKAVGKRLLSEAVKGGMIGAAQAGAEVGVREAINPADYSAMDNLKHVGFGTAIGAAADPLMYGAGKGIAKGFESAASRSMRNLLPNPLNVQGALDDVVKVNRANKALPIRNVDDLIPRGSDITNPDFLPKLQPKPKPQVEIPKVGTKTMNDLVPANQREFNEVVQQQYEYLKSSMGKGVDSGTTSNGLAGNFKQVTGTYNVSQNPKWYQDFYAQNGRKPNEKELWELAEQHIREGFDDEVGRIPPWSPKKVQDIDREIEQVVDMMRQAPEQKEVLDPYLKALKEDRTSALKEAGMDPDGKYQFMRQNKSQPPSHMTIYRNGRPDGNWWSENKAYADSFYNRPSQEKQIDINKLKILDSTESPQSFYNLLTEEEMKWVQKEGWKQVNVNKQRQLYIDVLERNGYDGWKFLDALDDDTDAVTYFLTDPTGKNKKTIIAPDKPYQYTRASGQTVKRANADLLPPVKPKQSNKLPENVQAMQSELIPLRAPSGKKVKPISRQELLNSTRKNLGVTIRHGRLGNVPDNVGGYFKVDPEVIRTRNYGDIGVISHEIGHHLDKQFKLTNAAFDTELMKLGAVTSGKGYTPQQIREEGLAEFIRLYLSDPQKALTDAPNFSQHFENVLPPKVKKGLMKTQADVDRWIEQGPEMRLRGKIDRTGKEVVTAGERVDKLYSQFIDKFDRLKKVETQVTGKLNTAEQSLYKKARLSVGAPKKAEMILRDFKGILKPIDKYGYSMKDVSDYAAAVHARELETLNIESGMTKQEIDAVIAKFDTPNMNTVHQGLLKYNNMLLDMLKEGGVLSKEAVDAMKKKYPNYVPFYRFFEDDIAQGFGGKGFANLTSPVKRLKGSTRDIIDPLESMVKNTFAVVNAVEKNKVGLELSRLADIEGAGRFIERLHGKQQVKKEHIVTVFENGEKVQYQLDKDLYEAIQQLDEDTTNKVIQLLSVPTSTLRAGATLTPEFMLRNPIRDQFQAFVVSNYGYNPIIDLPMGAWQVFKGKALNKDGLYKQWAKEGGGYGNYLSQDRNYLRETLDTLKKDGKWYQRGYQTITHPKEWKKILDGILRPLQAMSEFTEEATKLGEFRRVIKKGEKLEAKEYKKLVKGGMPDAQAKLLSKQKGISPQEAAYQSRDLMDFGRVGTDMRQWNRAVAFLNANLQGKDKIARAFKHNPVRTTVKAITGVTLPAVGAYVMMDTMANEKQKETYANTPKWMKDTFFIIPIPGTDELARIPKPFDLAPVFANPVEQIMDYIKDNDPDGWGEFLKRQAMEMLKIPYMLTGLTPIIENITNHSFFTGGPVVPRRDQDLLPQDQYGVTTSLTARTVGKLTGEGGALSLLPDLSPYKVDNFIRGYGAGLGKYATAGSDKLLGALKVGTLPPQEQKKWSELPVMNAFTVDSTGGGQVMTDFYDTLDKLTKERNSAKRNQPGYESGDEVNYGREEDYKYINKVSREISDLRNQYRSIQASYDLTPQEKRTQLDELDRQMNQLAREALIDIGEKTK